MKNYLIIISLLILIGCGKTDNELAMERGIQFYEWNLFDKAIKEFSYIVYQLQEDKHQLDINERDLLARAHHNLAVSYAKKEWYDVAESEAKIAFQLNPTDDNRKILKAIQGKQKKPEKEKVPKP
ncbi:MAG: hypothetical protein ISR90_02605 [Candidatus Marinimicrobia bacterium]|nr:hypothetical protein [Candidatus Neomarinimicrobiota bacterium]MBL7022931.1 hypothetical protein [Candidatus Neomarinimicrobiota bacterium]MBL7108749.1 hypothetical protein [Candidatus Neomarinimicrobiota bacterium]